VTEPGTEASRDRNHSPGDHSPGAAIEVIPVLGLPEFRPGDDLATAVVDATPWLESGDVVVVTSKVFSKSRVASFPHRPIRKSATRHDASWWIRKPSASWHARAAL